MRKTAKTVKPNLNDRSWFELFCNCFAIAPHHLAGRPHLCTPNDAQTTDRQGRLGQHMWQKSVAAGLPFVCDAIRSAASTAGGHLSSVVSVRTVESAYPCMATNLGAVTRRDVMLTERTTDADEIPAANWEKVGRKWCCPWVSIQNKIVNFTEFSWKLNVTVINTTKTNSNLRFQGQTTNCRARCVLLPPISVVPLQFCRICLLFYFINNVCGWWESSSPSGSLRHINNNVI